MVDDSAGCFFHTPLIDLILSPTIGNRLVTNYATYALFLGILVLWGKILGLKVFLLQSFGCV